MKAGQFVLTAVALAAGCLWAGQAAALGLGRLTVQSALGETLKAEIDVTSLTSDEAGSLALRIASPDAYRAAGVEFNAALSGAQVSLQRRSDGRPFLRVQSDRPLNEPFVDVIVEATWSSGRLVREFTLLLDPRMALLTTMPMGGTVGTQVEITITGEHLDGANELTFSDSRLTATRKLDATSAGNAPVQV